MKRSMSEYAVALSGSDIDALELLISLKFKAFKHFYRLVEERSDDIASLSYDMSKEESLHVYIETVTKDAKFAAWIKSHLEHSDYSYQISSCGKKVDLQISVAS